MAIVFGISNRDICLFYERERELFLRLTRDLKKDPASIKLTLALWLWFEATGDHGFILTVSSFPNVEILPFLTEAEFCIQCLFKEGSSTTSSSYQRLLSFKLPLTSSLLKKPINLGLLERHRDIMLTDVVTIVKYVVEIFCDEALVNSTVSDVSSEQHSSSSLASSCSTNKTPEEHRTLFIVFFKVSLMTENEILFFFNSLLEKPCVEQVVIDHSSEDMAKWYGRVVFSNASSKMTLLNGKQFNKFVINGRPLWART